MSLNKQPSTNILNPGAFQAYNRPSEPNANDVFGIDK
jgi:hypothetical protein